MMSSFLANIKHIKIDIHMKIAKCCPNESKLKTNRNMIVSNRHHQFGSSSLHPETSVQIAACPTLEGTLLGQLPLHGDC